MQSRIARPVNRLEQFQLELDALYRKVLGQVGETDAHYIRRVLAIKTLLHCLVLDGVYRNSTAVFHEVAASTLEELQALLQRSSHASCGG